MNKLNKLEKQIGIAFKNKRLLENAFVHRSYLNEHKDFPLQSNEKLEFLGDSVLSLITSMYLYNKYPTLHEGDYTEIKSAVVKTHSLAKAALDLNLGEYLYLSRGEEAGKGRSNTNLLADCFEALIASIFIDKGFNAAYDFVLAYLFRDDLDHLVTRKQYFSAKSKLQEYSQAVFKSTPVYKIMKEEGPEHKRIFTVVAYVNNKNMGSASGKSKKEAEEKVAAKALAQLES